MDGFRFRLDRRFRNTISHGFNLSSVYSQDTSGTECCAVTTLHSHGAFMVDYIFYSAGRGHAEGCDGRSQDAALIISCQIRVVCSGVDKAYQSSETSCMLLRPNV